MTWEDFQHEAKGGNVASMGLKAAFGGAAQLCYGDGAGADGFLKVLQSCLSAVSASGQISGELCCSQVRVYLLQPPTGALAWWVFSPETVQELQDLVKEATSKRKKSEY